MQALSLPDSIVVMPLEFEAAGSASPSPSLEPQAARASVETRAAAAKALARRVREVVTGYSLAVVDVVDPRLTSR